MQFHSCEAKYPSIFSKVESKSFQMFKQVYGSHLRYMRTFNIDFKLGPGWALWKLHGYIHSLNKVQGMFHWIGKLASKVNANHPASSHVLL